MHRPWAWGGLKSAVSLRSSLVNSITFIIITLLSPSLGLFCFDQCRPSNHPLTILFSPLSGEYVTCVLWNGLYHITGTDIVRSLVFRFEAFGRPVRNMKKFEEGVFSDLRNLKPGTDACLEEPKVSLS